MNIHPADQRLETLRFPAFLLVLALGTAIFPLQAVHPALWDSLAFPREGYVLSSNTYSFTSPDAPWINHQWLSLFLLNRLYAAFGSGGFVVVQTLCGFGLLLVCDSTFRRTSRSGALRILLLILLATTVGAVGFGLKPFVFSWLLFAWLAKRLDRPRLSLWFPVVMVLLGCLWANLDGAFFTGQILLALAALCAVADAFRLPSDIRRQTAFTLVSAASGFFLGSLMTPYGIQNWKLVFLTNGFCHGAALSGNIPYAVFTGFPAFFPFWLLAGLTAASLLVSRNNHLFPLCTLALTAVGACAGRFYIPLFAVSALILATEAMDDLLRVPLERALGKCPVPLLKIALTTAACLLAVVCVVRATRGPSGIPVPGTRFPTAAVTFLDRNQIEANALVYHDWSGLCLARLFPRVRLFLDNRLLAAYPESVVNDYLGFMSGQDLRAIDAYPVDLVLVPEKSKASRRMSRQPGWTAIYQDETSVVFVKSDVHTDIFRRQILKSLFFPENEPAVFP